MFLASCEEEKRLLCCVKTLHIRRLKTQSQSARHKYIIMYVGSNFLQHCLLTIHPPRG